MHRLPKDGARRDRSKPKFGKLCAKGDRKGVKADEITLVVVRDQGTAALKSLRSTMACSPLG